MGIYPFSLDTTNWDKTQVINEIVMYDRPSSSILPGQIAFQRRSTVWVNQIPNDGTAKAVSVRNKNSWVKFVFDGTGKDLGFSKEVSGVSAVS
jgi:hypothetical protein